MRKFGSEGTENGQLHSPVGVGILSSGNVVVGNFYKYDGTHLKTIGKGMIGYAAGVSMDLAGRIFVGDAGIDEMFVF